jgi:DUF1680 family protein
MRSSACSASLPGVQQQMLETAVFAGKPIILVRENGRPLDISWADKHIPAILESWYPGTEDGNAVADILFGQVNPGGKLPVSWPRAAGQEPLYYNHTLTLDPEDPPTFTLVVGIQTSNQRYGLRSTNTPMRTIMCFALCATSVLAGDLTERLNLTKARVLEGAVPKFDERFVLADASAQPGRRFTEFSGDVSGRYIGALSALALQSGERYAVLDRVVDGAIRLQQPDGHFGAPLSSGQVVDSDMATLWGNGRMLIGLLEYYALNHRSEALASARKLGDFLVRLAPRLNSVEVREAYNGEKFAVGYICWTNALEGVVELYRITKDERYLALARSIAERTDRHPSQHSHGFLTTVRGVVALYRATDEARYLDQAEALWAGIVESGNVLIQGAVPEMFAPSAKRDEGCSEADWVRLNLELWEVTGKSRYLEQAELTIFNEMAMNQFHTGDYGHHTLTNEGIAGPFARAWWCCTFHGLRALVAIFQHVFHGQAGALFYDLPVDGQGESEGFSVRADSALERTATVCLNVAKADQRVHALRIRMPDWATAVNLSLGGRPLEAQVDGRYLSVSRVWADR